MNILIVDRDEVNAQLIRSKLEASGHEVTVEPSKDEAYKLISGRPFDALFIDHAPMNDAAASLSKFRRAVGSHTYIVLLSAETNLETALQSAANNVLSKPADPQDLAQIMTDALRLQDIMSRIGDDSSDFPSAGGVIAKSAFNQIFLSAMERADRYGERAFILLISVGNYQEILELDGAYAADFVAAKLSRSLVKLRRQSDIIGQTAKYEYALMLQRPIYETEPVEAANRFAEALSGGDDVTSSGSTAVHLSVSLIDVPTGASLVQHVIEASEA